MHLDIIFLRCKNIVSGNINHIFINVDIYPAEQTDISVEFAQPGLLTVTDPPYEGGWNVAASPDGTLVQEGKEYGYLFYESETYRGFYELREGYTIPAEGRREAFEDILKRCGLNETEINDFCEFWCEKLESGVSYAMYPQLTDTVDRAMPVTVEPKPDSVLRVWFAFVPNDAPKEEPIIGQFERNGFTMVEWGGFILDRRES